MTRIKIIIGSNRPNRFGVQPAAWIQELAKEHPGAIFEIVDLGEINLPLLDEPLPAISGKYQNEHTKAWSKTIAEADGFVFVTPEYNHATSAVLKNAIDYLAAEWRHKPVAFVSYGVEGGVRATDNLRVIGGNLSMYPLYEQVSLVNYWSLLDENGKLVPTDEHAQKAHKMLTALIFWSETFKTAREKLQQ